MFTLEIQTSNDAFLMEDGQPDPREVARILRETADKVDDGHRDGLLRDGNGAKVGSWSWIEEAGEVKTFEIVRFYRDDEDRNQTVIKTGLTKAEAQEHCDDPETSSSTATDPDLTHGPWFDGWREETS